MRTASHVVEGRFTRGDERTFSRTVPFRVIPGRLESLRAFYDAYVFPAFVAADAESTDRDDAEPYTLTFQFTPDFDEVDRLRAWHGRLSGRATTSRRLFSTRPRSHCIRGHTASGSPTPGEQRRSATRHRPVGEL
jgi:hypothetical protein